MKLCCLVLVACGSAPPPPPQPAAAPPPTSAPATVVEKRQQVDLEAVREAIDSAKASGSWDAALPLLTRAATEVTDDDVRSVDAAMRAAEALGEAHAGLDALASLANRYTTKKIVTAQIAAIRALAKMPDRDGAAAALVKLVSRVPPTHPRRARSKDEMRAL